MQRLNEKTEIETINERLSEEKPQLVAHWISCELSDKADVWLNKNKEEEICFYLTKAELIKNARLDISKVITQSIIEDIILFDGDEKEIYNIVKDTIDRQDEEYLSYKKCWQHKKDLLSPIFEIREIAKLEDAKTSVRVNCIFDRDYIKRDCQISAINSLIACYQEELVKIGIQFLF